MTGPSSLTFAPKKLTVVVRFSIVGLFSVVLLACSSGSNDSSSSQQTPVVQTSLGPVQGLVRNGVNEYRGIPYALAPTGNLRWAIPQPVTASWSNVFKAYEFGPACPQQARFNLTEESLNEDCLSINVSVPTDIKPGEKLPVLFWIHGGAFVGGSSSLYRLDKLAREGRLVVVSANYRLGVLGFMPNPAFASNGYNGNYGLEDQRLAMKWVQDNIEAFGGDRNNVTIAGESAGAGSTCMHLASPEQVVSQSQIKVKNLFHKAIVQSAGCLQEMPTVTEAQASGSVSARIQEALCPAVEYPTNTAVLACMRRQKVEDILVSQGKNSEGEIVAFSPVIGTTAQPNATVPTPFNTAATTQGGLVNVPMIMGGTRDELSLYVGYYWQNREKTPINSSTIMNWLGLFYNPQPQGGLTAIISKYPDLKNADDVKVAATLGSVLSHYNPKIGLNNCLFLHTSDVILNSPSRNNKPVYQFEFADAAAPVCGVGISEPCPPFLKNGGAVHSSELNYLFPNLSNTKAINAPDLAPASQALANQMVAYWAKFAYTGSPNVAGLPSWPEYRGETVPFGGDSVMLLDPNNVKAYNSDNEHSCSSFWSGQYPLRLQ